MRLKISLAIKKQVADRAGGCCEYCQLPERVSFYNSHVDHIKSVKHGGTSVLDNLAHCCPDCNFHKGSDVGTFSADDAYLIRFFNPRKDDWHDHFEVHEGALIGKIEIGESTVRIFQFNDTEQLLFRRQLISLDLYPPF